MKKFYYVYILKSKKDHNMYTGFTDNLVTRFKQHSDGLVKSTRERRPIELVYYEGCLDKHDAMHRELYLKTHHGKQYLYKRLKSYLTG